MKITFLGVSGALESGPGNYNSNMLIDTPNGKTILIDAGTDLPHSLAAAGRTVDEIDAIYVSHLHADHCGGLEWLGYLTYFHPKLEKLPLYIHPNLVKPLWENSLKAGMETLHDEDKKQLTDYFDLPELTEGKISFEIDGVKFGLIRLPHVAGKESNILSYGLMVLEGIKRIFISTDTSASYLVKTNKTTNLDDITNLAIVSQFMMCDLIFHDCTIGYDSPVHAPYDFLKANISPVFRNKMWLYHYSPTAERPNARADGFAGFVETGQVFEV